MVTLKKLFIIVGILIACFGGFCALAGAAGYWNILFNSLTVEAVITHVDTDCIGSSYYDSSDTYKHVYSGKYTVDGATYSRELFEENTSRSEPDYSVGSTVAITVYRTDPSKTIADGGMALVAGSLLFACAGFLIGLSFLIKRPNRTYR